MGGRQAQEGALHWQSQDLKLLLGSVDMRVVSPGKLVNVSSPYGDWVMNHQFCPHIRWGEFLALDSQTLNGIFHQLLELCIRKTLLYVQVIPFNISSLGCDSLSVSKPPYSAIRFPNCLPNSYSTIAKSTW
jgi:hypothetical protein